MYFVVCVYFVARCATKQLHTFENTTGNMPETVENYDGTSMQFTMEKKAITNIYKNIIR